jgi:flagellar biosynthesis protein FlhF
VKLRVFPGPDLASALASLRDSLGEDALILETREIAAEAGGGVEVLAAVDTPEPVPARTARAAGLTVPQRRDALAWQGIGPDLAARLMEADLLHALTKTLAFGDLPLENGGPPLLFAGEPGAGKSLTVLKLATRLVLGGETPLVISTDGRKAGAAEQLAAVTRILGLPLIVADDAAELARAVRRRPRGAPVLIDGPGLVVADAEDAALLRALAGAVGAEIVHVLPAGLDACEAAETALDYAAAGARLLLATRMDVSRRIGAVVEAAFRSRLQLTMCGTGPDIAGGLEPLTASMIADRLQAPAGRPARAGQDAKVRENWA